MGEKVYILRRHEALERWCGCVNPRKQTSRQKSTRNKDGNFAV